MSLPCLTELSIYHLDLFVNSEQKRQEKVLRYSKTSIQDGMLHYYLPNTEHLDTKRWNYSEVISSVQKFVEQLPMKCKICEAESQKFAKTQLLNKYVVGYFQCSECGFVQTEEPYWLEEAYSEAIASSDVGLVFRNNTLSKMCTNLLLEFFDHNAKFLDYGGGYGLFVRIMRDSGFDFHWHDKFCKNIFAQGFEVSDHDNKYYEIVTAFEVFEHFINPIDEIKRILKFSKNIIFSTELLPQNNPKPNEWWYYAPHEGQHISVYTTKALAIVAEKFNLNFYSNGTSLHILTEKNLPLQLFDRLFEYNQENFKKSLLQQDYLNAIGKTNNITTNYRITTTKDDEQDVTATTGIRTILDGVFFQLYKTGIARVWKSLFEEWVNNGFAKHIVVLDRAGTAPVIPGIRYRSVPAYDYGNTDADREMLQQVCDEEGADLFISSYYTTPLSTPSVFVAYDMIPELMGWDLNHPMWREKHYGIQNAAAYIAISENTARDLVQVFPEIALESVTVAKSGVDRKVFSPANSETINQFKTKYGISKPYFILVGAGGNYKNSILFFKAFAQLYSSQGFDIICTGSGFTLEADYRAYTSGITVHLLQLSDEELSIAYSGAVALVYPSKYEGFGLPVLEAIACGCPVITCPNASIPEVAGEAALYINDEDVEGLTNALCDVQKPNIRNSLIAAGLEQAKKFSWSKMAETVSSALIDATLLPLNLSDINLIIFPDWSQPEETLCLELEQVIKAIASHLDSSKTTLLIDNGNIPEEEAALIVSSVSMNLLMQEELDISEGLEISFLGQLGKIQWKALLPRIQARIVLENENQEAIALFKAENIPSRQIKEILLG